MINEIIVTNTTEAKIAQDYGANRLELIHSFTFGGLSPNLEITKEVCDQTHIPINVMLRTNNSKNFLYSKTDMAHMLKELEFIRLNTKANGIVFGALDKFGNIDINALNLIINNKGHLKLTFHRAIDVSTNIIASYQQLLTIPQVDWVLTSGGAQTALEGINTIHKMVSMSHNYKNAKIIAASGITPDNATYIIQKTKVQEIHIGTGVRKNNQISPDLLIELKNLY